MKREEEEGNNESYAEDQSVLSCQVLGHVTCGQKDSPKDVRAGSHSHGTDDQWQCMRLHTTHQALRGTATVRQNLFKVILEGAEGNERAGRESGEEERLDEGTGERKGKPRKPLGHQR